MTTYLVAVHLLVEAGPDPRPVVDTALQDILSDATRLNRGPRSNLIDWAVAGEDLAASIAPVELPSGYTPDETPFPDWPRQRGLGASHGRAR
ncbi:hypothetical protein [Mesorhizobium sp. L-2-11]|uniref:hypothetical protein n=1 Tax=Mesorhizobium sp. L-2-11 TaxID=2744521 RepID=UPI001926BEFD|nr:hypothetical protein [Mesorhizobium sp. L-2-11]BCH19552.1 hypothetical protein MesoLjLa_64030 [Mesorhizobium sp. L-2-11]